LFDNPQINTYNKSLKRKEMVQHYDFKIYFRRNNMKNLVRLGILLAVTASAIAVAERPTDSLRDMIAKKTAPAAQPYTGMTAPSGTGMQRRSLPATGLPGRLHNNGKAWILPSIAKSASAKTIIYTLCSQDFESDWTGWTAVDGNGDAVAWKVGTTVDLATYRPPSYETYYAYYSDDDAGTAVLNTNEEWVSPAFAIPDTTPVPTEMSLSYGWGFRISGAGQHMHSLARVFYGAGWGAWDTLVTYSGTGNGTEVLDLSGYLTADSIQLKWVYEDINATEHWGYACAVDNIVLTAIPLNYDVKPLALLDPDPSAMVPPNAVINPAAMIRNAGCDTAFNFTVTLLIDSAGSSIYSQTVTVDTLIGMDTATAIFPFWTTGPAGSYLYDFIMITNFAQDQIPENDTINGQLQAFTEIKNVGSPFSNNIPNYDGVIDTLTEWNDAVKIDISDVFGAATSGMRPGSAYMYLKNDNSNLYVAVDVIFDSTFSNYDQFGLYFDDNHNHNWEDYPDTTEGNYWVGNFITASLQTRFICSGPNYGTPNYNRDGFTPLGYSLASGHMQYEIAVPFGGQTDPGYLNAFPGRTFGFWMYALDYNTYAQGGWWPQSATWDNPATYATITLGTSGLPDAGITEIRGPGSIVPVDSVIVPQAKVMNFGSSAADFSVTCVIDTNGTTIYSNIQNVTALGSLDTILVTFPLWVPDAAINYRATMYITYGADSYPGNDTLSMNITAYLKNLDVISPYTTALPTFDGSISIAEWSDAVKVDISDVYGHSGIVMPPGSGFMYLKNDDANLYMAIDAVLDSSYGSSDCFYLILDDNHNHVFENYPDTTEGYYMIGNFSADSIMTTYICSGSSFGGTRNRDGITPLGFTATNGHMQYEVAIPLGEQTDPAYLNASPGRSFGLWMFVVDNSLGYVGWWPQTYYGMGSVDPAGFGTVTLGASGKPDVALAAIRSPGKSVGLDSAIIPVAKVANLCSLAVDFPVFCVIDTNGIPVYSDSQNVVGLDYMDTLLVPFAPWNPDTPLVYNVTMYVRYAGDLDPKNDTLKTTTLAAHYYWEVRASLPEPATAAAEAGYKNKLYMFGGYYGSTSGTEDKIMIYNANTNAWSTSNAVLSEPGYFNTAVTVKDKIFIMGGIYSDYIGNLDCYSPNGDSLNPRADMPSTGHSFSAGVWRDSIIYRFGGFSDTGCINTVALYDIAGDAWVTSATPLPIPLYFGCAAILGDTIVISTGSDNNNLLDTTIIGLINPGSPDNITWSFGPKYPGGPVYGAGGGYVGNEAHHGLLINGGYNYINTTAATYLYTTADGWVIMPDKNLPVFYTGGGQVGNYFVMAGGYDGGFYAYCEALYLGSDYNGVIGNPTEISNIPSRLCLMPSWPNPVKGRATFSYQLPSRTRATLTLYNIMGQKVKTLASGMQEAGTHQVSWNCDDNSGRRVATGIYFYNLRTDNGSLTRKLVVVK
jgi:ribosomal protein L24E